MICVIGVDQKRKREEALQMAKTLLNMSDQYSHNADLERDKVEWRVSKLRGPGDQSL